MAHLAACTTPVAPVKNDSNRNYATRELFSAFQSDINEEMEYVLTQVNIVANESRQLESTLTEYCSKEVEAVTSKTEVLFEEFEEKLRKVKAEWREELSQFNESRQLESTLRKYCSDEVKAVRINTQLLFEELKKVKAEWREELSEFKISLLRKHFRVSDLFYGKRYLATKAAKMFSLESANAECQEHNGYLLELNGRKELNFVVGFLKEGRFRVGANDVKKEGHFVNFNSNTISTVLDLPWGENQPDNWDGVEDCVEIVAHWKALNDNTCDMHSKYVCEVPF